MNLADVLALGGFALFVGGIAALSIPAACIVAGLVFMVLAGAEAARNGKG